MKKVLFRDINAGQIFRYNGILYSKLTFSLTIDQQERCNLARSSKINAIRTDKSDGFWFDSLDEVEVEQK